MERDCYSPNVQFVDPLTSLQGIYRLVVISTCLLSTCTHVHKAASISISYSHSTNLRVPALLPLLACAGVDSYQKNVDMLGARTLMGKALFSDAGIVLHNIEVRFVPCRPSFPCLVCTHTHLSASVCMFELATP